jgi:hypothetical protein
MPQDNTERPIERRPSRLEEEMVELSFLLPGRQAAELERLAHSRDLTVGQLIRLLIHDYLADPASSDQFRGRQTGSLRCFGWPVSSLKRRAPNEGKER